MHPREQMGQSEVIFPPCQSSSQQTGIIVLFVMKRVWVWFGSTEGRGDFISKESSYNKHLYLKCKVFWDVVDDMIGRYYIAHML